MSLNSILSIARSALLTHQQAVDTASHNIANASTEGYSRQRLELSAADPLRTAQGTIGRGVTSDGVRRARDQFLDASYRQESSLLGRFDTTRQLVAGLEDVLGEPGEAGLAVGLDSLLDAFSDLANDPSNLAARTVVRENAAALTHAFRSTADRLAGVGLDVIQRMRDDLANVNALARDIAGLNQQIISAAHGHSAPDLEDRRDMLIDQLSSLIDVQVVPHERGTVGIVAGGALLVDGAQHGVLELRALASGGQGIGVAGSGGPVALSGGSLKALSDLTTATIPGLQRKLDQFARAVVTEVNAIHRSGRTAAGETGVDFFDPAGVTAHGMQLSDAVRQSTANIVTGGSGAAGDGALALQIAQLRSTAVGTAEGQTLAEYFNAMVASVGVLGRSAEVSATSQDALLANIAAQRSSVTDVSIDEEMVALIKSQQAFAAASKIVLAADDMIQSVLDMV